MPLYTFHRVQSLPISREQAWGFISDPKNLAVITPPQMGFKTLSGDDREMFAGQIIHYTITPMLGIAMEWVTEITHVEPGRYFTDEQRHGPYAFWHHKHFLRDIPGGVEMEDVIHYRLPLGAFGSLAHRPIVLPQLERIFEFRKQKLIALFGVYNRP